MRHSLRLALLGCVLIACKEPKPTPNDYTVNEMTLHKTLHFVGRVKPLYEIAVASPVDGMIETMSVAYGQPVKQGQLLFSLNSPQLHRQYNDSLTQYLESKERLSVARSKFSGTSELWKAGLISRNTYLTEQASFNSARISLIQQTNKLSELFTTMGDEQQQQILKLNISNFKQINALLNTPHNQLQIRAPSDGVLLYPPKVAGEELLAVKDGTAVKAGNVLAVVGDLRGIRIEIEVPEIELDKITLGMKAKVHGLAFANKVLAGRIITIHQQALSNNNETLPSFIALVEVNPLSKEQASWVKVGMSASVELISESKHKLMIPITAIKQIHGENRVDLRNGNDCIISRVVITGAVEGDKVVIESGLKAGDIVFI